VICVYAFINPLVELFNDIKRVIELHEVRKEKGNQVTPRDVQRRKTQNKLGRDLRAVPMQETRLVSIA
jgi:hypothetical protein